MSSDETITAKVFRHELCADSSENKGLKTAMMERDHGDGGRYVWGPSDLAKKFKGSRYSELYNSINRIADKEKRKKLLNDSSRALRDARKVILEREREQGQELPQTEKERVDSNADGVEEFCKNEITDGIQHDRDEQRGDGNALIGGEGAVVEPLERDGLDGDGKAHLGGGGGVTVHQDDDKENDEFNEEEKKEEDSNILSELISMFCHLVLCRSMNLTRFLSISCFETKRTSWSDSSTSC